MFKLEVVAGNMKELRERLISAADGIAVDEVGAYPSDKDMGYAEGPTPVTSFPDRAVGNAPAIPTQGRTVEQAPRFPVKPDVAPTVQQAVVENSGQGVDKRGFPWDARIHSSNKEITVKGVWRSKRGVDDALVAQVEQELIEKIKSGEIDNDQPVTAPTPFPGFPPAAPQAAPASVAPPAPTPFPGFPPAAPQAALAVPNHAPQAVPMPAPVTGAPGVPAHSFESFTKNMIQVLAGLTSSGKLTQAHIENMKNALGVRELWAVTSDQARQLYDSFVEWGWITQVGE